MRRGVAEDDATMTHRRTPVAVALADGRRARWARGRTRRILIVLDIRQVGRIR